MTALNREFHERTALKQLAVELAIKGQDRHIPVPDTSLQLFLHRMPSGNKLISIDGRVTGEVRGPDGFIFHQHNMPREAVSALNGLYRMHFISPGELVSRWQAEVESSQEFLKSLIGFQLRPLKLAKPIYVSAFDSYCSSNCIPGTRQYIRKFMPDGWADINDFISMPDLHWQDDRFRAVAWAVSLESRTTNAISNL